METIVKSTTASQANNIIANQIGSLEVNVVTRDEIPSISEIEVAGIMHSLGEHRDFRRNAKLDAFLPEMSRFSVSWVRLKDGEELKPHQHPTSSMIVMAKGQGFVTGQKSGLLKEGDVITIPPNCSHGFIGKGPEGLHALSIQFGEVGGLYEDTDKPLVRFLDDDIQYSLDHLLAHNRQKLEDLKHIRFFTMLTDGTLEDEVKRQRYLDLLDVWVRRNQLLLFTRQATCIDPKYESTFLKHFHEEIGHDVLFDDRKKSADVLEDPVIEAVASWFVHQMYVLDNVGKAAIIHLVIENASDYYHHVARPLLGKDVSDEYFSAHEIDCEHAQMGIDMLSGLDEQTYRRLVPIIDKAWSMLNAWMDRVATLTLTM